MEYIEFFLFCIVAFGIPISIVALKYHSDKKKIKKLGLTESGVEHNYRATNRHKNTFYPVALTMIFTYIPLLLLIPLIVMRQPGDAYSEQLYMSLFLVICTFMGYMIFRLSGGFNDPQ